MLIQIDETIWVEEDEILGVTSYWEAKKGARILMCKMIMRNGNMYFEGKSANDMAKAINHYKKRSLLEKAILENDPGRFGLLVDLEQKLGAATLENKFLKDKIELLEAELNGKKVA